MGAKAGELREIPGPRTKEWCDRNADVSVKTTDSWQIVFKNAEGTCLYDADGNQYLDLGSPGTNFAGYGSILEKYFLPKIRVMFYVGMPMFATTDWGACETIRAKEKIRDATTLSGKSKVFGGRTGGLVVETALKALRAKFAPQGREYFLAFFGAFHGRPHGALSLMDPHKKERLEDYTLPYHTFFLKFPFLGHPYPEELVDTEFGKLERWGVLKNISGLFMELVQGQGGIRIMDPAGLKRIEAWCRGYDIKIMADEIQTGMGRTGTRWCYEQYDLLPDGVMLGKALGGNAQDGNALVIREDLSFERMGRESSTYELPPVVATTVLTALDLLAIEKLPARAAISGKVLGSLLEKHFSGKPHITAVRGLGLMWGVECATSAFRDTLMDEALKRGLLLSDVGFSEHTPRELVCGPTIRLAPPLTVTEEELEKAITIGAAAYEATLDK